jgi:uncharacterized protein (TIGR03546 family)
MFFLQQLFRLINILNKDATPPAIAGGMALGAVMGITPLLSLHNFVIFIVILMIRVNVTAALFSMGIFTLISYMLDPLFNSIGYALLVEAEGLTPFWTRLYNTPFVPWTQFNNTLTLGSLVFSVAAFWPLYFLLKWGVVKYRSRVMVYLQNTKVVKAIKASKIYMLYSLYS